MGHNSCLMVEKTAQRASWLSGHCWGESGANPALTQAPGTGPTSVFEKNSVSVCSLCEVCLFSDLKWDSRL